MMGKIKPALVLLLALVVWTGTALADVNDTGAPDDPVNDTLSNSSVNGTEDNNVTDNLTDELFNDSGVFDETDDIPPFEGAVGPEHALYGLKIAFGNVGETFTYNATQRLGKQVSAARHRIAEARAEMEKGNDEAAGLALGHYKNKTDEINATINKSDVNQTGLAHAMNMTLKHRAVLQNLIQQKLAEGKNVHGLMNALNNSFRLEEKFNLKMEEKAQKTTGWAHEMNQMPDTDTNVSGDMKPGKGNKNK